MIENLSGFEKPEKTADYSIWKVGIAMLLAIMTS
jgi:hypothetical protein